MKIRYIGTYTGFAPVLKKNLKPGDVVEVSESLGQRMLTSAQFEEVKEKKPSKELPETGGEI